jgi:hypothetical protein
MRLINTSKWRLDFNVYLTSLAYPKVYAHPPRAMPPTETGTDRESQCLPAFPIIQPLSQSRWYEGIDHPDHQRSQQCADD